MEKLFLPYKAAPENPKWEQMISRQKPLYNREHDVRSPFLRDYTRILHSSAFRRLKHKTQVFFSPQSDHICTRIEHVLHVESIGCAIASSLGLNEELVRAIAIGHDLGHSPFGHKGEKALNAISLKELGERFWHERNSLFLVDSIELLEDSQRHKRTLDLTYAVRDGIISHCGEVEQNHLIPRAEAGDLYRFREAGTFQPYTFEGCVVKMADKISYVGRDIEDAKALGILDAQKMQELGELVGTFTGNKINNTIIINDLIGDLCSSSDPEKGICFSKRANDFLSLLKAFNSRNIYQTPRVTRADKYFELVISELFYLLYELYDGENTLFRLKKLSQTYPVFIHTFLDWLSSYWQGEREESLDNAPIFDLTDRKSYGKAILTYIAGMTDKYALDSYNDIISF